jgi:ankyrin repeat protein
VSALLALCLALSTPTSGAGRALLDAARAGEVKKVKALVTAGADVNAADGAGTTPLMAASAAGQTFALAALADAGADLDLRDRLGRTALDLALAAGNEDAVRLLRRRGARGSGKSPGDIVCVERWSGRGFCGTIERVEPVHFTVRVTRVTGCADGCPADEACSDGQEIDPAQVGRVLRVSASCLTRTFPGSASASAR